VNDFVAAIKISCRRSINPPPQKSDQMNTSVIQSLLYTVLFILQYLMVMVFFFFFFVMFHRVRTCIFQHFAHIRVADDQLLLWHHMHSSCRRMSKHIVYAIMVKRIVSDIDSV